VHPGRGMGGHPLRKAFQRHGVGRPARNPEAVRKRAMAAASRSAGQLATDPGRGVVVLNPGALPGRERSPAELYEWVRREKQCAKFGADLVVELCSESPGRR
jgi:hypothetical protein